MSSKRKEGENETDSIFVVLLFVSISSQIIFLSPTDGNIQERKLNLRLKEHDLILSEETLSLSSHLVLVVVFMAQG